MRQRYEDLVRRVRDTVLGATGESDAALRQSVAAYAGTDVSGTDWSGASVPASLRSYVDKVARSAYTVTDADVGALQRAGYAEDVIFEITVSAAVGAGMHRLERGLAALKGGG